MDSFEKGVILKNHCEKMLKDARLKIEKITKTETGEITLPIIFPGYRSGQSGARGANLLNP